MMSLLDLEKKYNLIFTSDKRNYEDFIIKLYNSSNIDVNNYDFTNNFILFFIGEYYNIININYDLMKKYYLMAIDNDNHYAMYNLGYYYQYIEMDYDLMKKYYLMAVNKYDYNALNQLDDYYNYIRDYDNLIKFFKTLIKKNNQLNISAMFRLGYFYQQTKNYNLMKIYLLMAINREHSEAMYILGYYYQYTEINYDLMKKYYLMAINKGLDSAMHHLGFYYENIEKNYELMLKYYLIAIEHKCCRSQKRLDNTTLIVKKKSIKNL